MPSENRQPSRTNNHANGGIRCLIFLCAVLALGGDSDIVRKHVARGVMEFRRNNFVDAAKAFADAELLDPENLTIKFNRACAEARIRDRTDGARERALILYREAARTRDPKLATAAHYNLGSLESLEAKGIFGGTPEEVEGADRERGMEHLTNAIGHYRKALVLDPDHVEARRNIEIIRAWQANMRKVWKEQDDQEKQEQQQPEESLVQVLTKLDASQHTAFLKNSAGRTRPGKEALLELQSKATQLLPELREKVAAEFSVKEDLGPEQQQALEQVRGMFMEMTSQVATAAEEAGRALANSEGDASVASQADALDGINQMFAARGQFPDYVNHSLRLQEKLAATGRFPSKPVELPIRDGNPLLERQSRVGLLAEGLAEKATQFRTALEQQLAADPGQNALIQQQMEGFLTAAKRAEELSPDLNDAIAAASKELLVQQVDAATPHMKEALEILRKIAETLPQDQSGNDGQDDQQDRSVSPVSADDGDEEQQEPDEDEQKQAQQQEQQQKEQEIRDKEAAEKFMRQVRDREQTFKEQKEQLRALRAQRARVERDW